MSMTYNNDLKPETSITDAEGVMFAATPAWERNRKRRGLGARKEAASAATVVAAEPRSFAADSPLDRPMGAPTPHTPLASDHDAPLAAPIGRPTTARTTRAVKSNGAAPAVIAATVVGLGALGAAGWWMSQDDGVPELAAGSTTSEVAAAPVMPMDPPTQMAVNEAAPPPMAAPPVETPRAAAAPVERRAVPRARPAAAAPSAASAGVNASTTVVLPDGPQPYSAVNPSATPAEVNPPLVTLPPTTEAPAEALPATPPIQAEPTPAPSESEAPPT